MNAFMPDTLGMGGSKVRFGGSGSLWSSQNSISFNLVTLHMELDLSEAFSLL